MDIDPHRTAVYYEPMPPRIWLRTPAPRPVTPEAAFWSGLLIGAFAATFAAVAAVLVAA